MVVDRGALRREDRRIGQGAAGPMILVRVIFDDDLIERLGIAGIVDRRGRGRRERKRKDKHPAQMWITRPNAARTLSCIISDSVGWGKTDWMKSSSTSSAVLPIV